MFRLTRGGWALLFLSMLMTLGAFNAGLNITYLLASLLISVFLVGVLAPPWSLYGMDCRRAMRDMPFAHEPFEISVLVRSRRGTAAHVVTIFDPLCGESEEAGRKVILRLPPRASEALRYVGRPRERGVYLMPGLRRASGFPFGIAECGVAEASAGELLVYPARGQLSRAMAGALKPMSVRMGARSHFGLPGEDFRSLREYRIGDHPRRIHWRVSAHLGRLHVREMERERSEPVIVLLDSRIPGSLAEADRTGAAEALELAVSFAAEVCRVALHEGNTVRVVGFFPEPRILSGNRGNGGGAASFPHSHLLTFLEALARLKPSDSETGEALIPLAQQCGLSSARRVIAVTPVPATAQSFKTSLAGWRAHVLVVSDPAFANVFRLTPVRGGGPP